MKDLKKIRIARASVDRRGREGHVAQVRCGTKYPKVYTVMTHGMSPEAFAEKVAAMDVRHAAKEAKIDDLQAVARREFHANATRYRVSSLSVRERGEDPEFVMSVSRFEEGGWVRIGTIRRVYAEMRLLPDSTEALSIARAYAEESELRDIKQKKFVADVERLLRT